MFTAISHVKLVEEKTRATDTKLLIHETWIRWFVRVTSQKPHIQRPHYDEFFTKHIADLADTLLQISFSKREKKKKKKKHEKKKLGVERNARKNSVWTKKKPNRWVQVQVKFRFFFLFMFSLGSSPLTKQALTILFSIEEHGFTRTIGLYSFFTKCVADVDRAKQRTTNCE